MSGSAALTWIKVAEKQKENVHQYSSTHNKRLSVFLPFSRICWFIEAVVIRGK